MRKKLCFMMCLILSIVSIAFVGCSSKPKDSESVDISKSSYEEILESAKGSSVSFYGYGGNEVMNKWFDKYVIPEMKEKYDINVKRVGMDIDDILNQLTSEKQADKKGGIIDVVWINGENFKTAKDNDLLMGPFVDKLPNYNNYVDTNSKEITTDFGTPVDNMEAPWGKAQFCLVKDGEKVPQVIKDTDTLKKFITDNPGKFTYAAMPDFEASAFVRNVIYDIVGYENVADLPEDEAKVKEVIKPAMDYLNEIKPYLWNKGETYPSTTPQLDNMYSDNEVYFTMTYAPNVIKGRIDTEEFNKNTTVVEFEKGNISNTHFLSIPGNSQNKAGAMVLIDFLMSIDAQGAKTDTANWGDISVLDMDKVPEDQKSKFKDAFTIEKSVPELKAGLVPIIEKIWTDEVLNAK